MEEREKRKHGEERKTERREKLDKTWRIEKKKQNREDKERE